MPFEALVGHLYVVGGRAIRTVPPGTLVEVAPHKAARGRELETFFILVLPSGDQIASPSFYENMARTAADTYFDTSGSVTAGLRQVFNKLNSDLFEHNQKQASGYEASVLCAVLRGSDLILGRIGSGIVLFYQNGYVTTFPEDLGDDDTLFLVPLGVHPVPNVKMTQYNATPSTRLVFGDSNVADLNNEQVSSALMSANLNEVLAAFKEMARLNLTLMVCEFVPPDTETGTTIPVGQSTTQIAEKTRTLAATETPTRQAPGKSLDQRARQSVGGAALSLSRLLKLVNQTIDHFFDRDSEGKKGFFASPLGAASIVLLPVLVVSLVVILWLSNTGRSEVDLCIEEAGSRAELARSLAQADRVTLLNAWEATLVKVDECNTLRPGDPILSDMRLEAQTVIDSLNQTTRNEAVWIESLPQARLTRIVAQGNDLYVLDSAISQVYQISLTNDGLRTTRPGTPIPAMRRGGFVSSFPVNDIIDIAFNERLNVLVALDSDGVLVECRLQFIECTGERLQGTERWVDPVAITVWSDRVYILDTGAGNGQIWRYDRTGDSYSQGPREYFDSTARPVLRTAIDLAIDGSGNVYVLMAEGVVRRFRDGRILDFGYALFPEGQVPNSARSFFLDDRSTAQSLYVVNQLRRTVYETSFIGSFDAGYRIYEEENFDLLEAVAITPGEGGREIMYAVSGNSVFAIDLGESTTTR
jgi:hypothetical protein